MLRTLFQACILDNFAEKFKLRDMEDLSFDNILSGEEVENLFADTSEVDDITRDDVPTEDKQEKDPEETEETDSTDANPFADDSDEDSTEEEDKTKDEEDTNSDESTASPNFYSSIAKALTEDGVFQNLDEEALKGVKDADTFKELVSKEVENQLNGVQRRISDALKWGTEPSEIQRHEYYINFLTNQAPQQIVEHSEQAENLRKTLIYQDYKLRGFTDERAHREVERSFKAGTDLEDAQEALKSNQEFWNNSYNKLLAQNKQEYDEMQETARKESAEIAEFLLGKNQVYGEITVDKSTRQRAYDFIMKPIDLDADGNKVTACQKMQLENRADFYKNVALCYALTDGFKNLDKVTKQVSKKEVKSSVKELERKLSKNSSVSGGNLKFVSGVSVDDDSSFSSGSWNNYGY